MIIEQDNFGIFPRLFFAFYGYEDGRTAQDRTGSDLKGSCKPIIIKIYNHP